MREQHLLTGGETVLTGVSGGPDSVALLKALRALAGRLRLRLIVAHVHHGLRGPAADDDQRFVEALAAESGCGYVTRHLGSSAQESEASLRAARYDALADLARETRASHVAVGHTLDDQAETILMRIIRGAGVDGLQGIPAARMLGTVRLIRPLRNVWRSDVEDWLRATDQSWREDATNADPAWMRNRIRRELLPELATAYNPQMKRVLCHLAESASAAWQCVASRAEQWLITHGSEHSGALALPRAGLLEQPRGVQQAILRHALRQVQGHLRRFTYQHWLEVEALLAHAPAGAVVDLPGQSQLVFEPDTLTVRRRRAPATAAAITSC